MRKVKVGIIGLGGWGTCHLEAFHSMPQVEVVALCDMNGERTRNLAERYAVPHVYSDSSNLLQRDDIDLISIVTFENNHFEPTIRALESGKHVLVEKPVSTKLQEASAMQKAAEQNDRLLFAGHLLRFESRYAEIYRAIRSERIGAPESMFFKRSRTKSMFHMYKRIHTVYELMTHDLDLAIWYSGSRVTKVKAYGKKVNDTTVPDILWASLEFANGTIAALHSNWMTPDEAGIIMNDAVEVIGSNGTAQFENSCSNLQLWDASGRNSPDSFLHQILNGNSIGALRTQLDYICDCVAGGRNPEYTSFHDAVHGIAVAEAIIQSLESGKEIVL